jgi:dihydroorotate dehydrogenase
VINRFGFNSGGLAPFVERLARRRGRPGIVGANVGKNRDAPDAAADYIACLAAIGTLADYVVVNVSSPNTPGLRALQAVDSLRGVLEAARAGAARGLREAGSARHVPLLVKIAPDLLDADVEAIADLALELGLEGVVAVNTTIAHNLGEGGLSGPPLLARGLETVSLLRRRLGDGPAIIGVGGITGPQDIRDYLKAGATLVQAYTAFIYEGPFWPARVQRQAGVLAASQR